MKSHASLVVAAMIMLSQASCDDGGDCGWAQGASAYDGTTKLSGTLDVGNADAGGDAGADGGASGVFLTKTASANVNWDPTNAPTDSNGDACNQNGIPITFVVDGCSITATVNDATYSSSGSDDDDSTDTFAWGSAKITGGTCTFTLPSATITLTIESGNVLWPDSATIQIDVAGNITGTTASGTESTGYATYTFNGIAD